MSSLRPPLREPNESATRLRCVLEAAAREERERRAREAREDRAASVVENERLVGPPSERLQADAERRAARTRLNEQLAVAVRHGDIDEARALVQRGARGECVDERGTSLLHTAINTLSRYQNPGVVHLLLENGAGDVVDLRDNYGERVRQSPLAGCTPLMMAVDRRNVAMVRLMLEARADPNVLCSGRLDGGDPRTAREQVLLYGGGGPRDESGRQIFLLLGAAGAM